MRRLTRGSGRAIWPRRSAGAVALPNHRIGWEKRHNVNAREYGYPVAG